MDREVEPRLHWRDNNYSMHAAAFDQQFCRKLLSDLQAESSQLRDQLLDLCLQLQRDFSTVDRAKLSTILGALRLLESRRATLEELADLHERALAVTIVDGGTP